MGDNMTTLQAPSLGERLRHGIVWGVIFSAIVVCVTLALFPLFNRFVLFAVVGAVVVSMGFGIVLNLRAVKTVCGNGHIFTATSASSQCPDCGEKYSDIARRDQR